MLFGSPSTLFTHDLPWAHFCNTPEQGSNTYTMLAEEYWPLRPAIELADWRRGQGWVSTVRLRGWGQLVRIATGFTTHM